MTNTKLWLDWLEKQESSFFSKFAYNFNEAATSRHMPSHCDVKLEVETKIATWLILPVVIHLTQKLSHAFFSINLLL
jgi:hypothetical protein